MDDEERALVERARAGDFEAFDGLVARHERRLYALALRIVRRAEDAEDAVQSAFLAAMEHLADYRGEAAFGTWVTRIATNAALRLLRKRKGPGGAAFESASGGGGEDQGETPPPELIADWRDDPVKTVERRELRRILDEAADGLSEKLRLAFLLRDVAGLSTEETAAALGITEATVKVRLLRARLQLREKLTRVFGDEATRVERPRDHDHDHGGGGGS